MSAYTENKRQMLALARERKAAGFATKECDDPGLVRTWVSELRKEGYEFVTFRLPDASEARYALAQFTGSRSDDYAALRAVHPEAHVKQDDRVPRRRPPGAEPFQESQRAAQTRRGARARAQEYRRKEATAADLEIYMRGRRRLLESIENVTSIPVQLMAAQVPADEAASLLEDLTDLRAYADVLVSCIHGKVEDAAFAERVAKLRNVDGRPPQEASAFLEAADRLEREREKRLSA